MKYTSKLILNWEEYEFAAPEQWWQPWADTLLYMPLNWDVLDYSWNNNNWTWTWTTDYRNIWTWSKKYAYINTDSAIALTSFPVWTWDPNDFTFACWTKTNQTTWYSIPFYMWTDTRGNRFNLILNYKFSASSYVHLIDLYWFDEDIVFMSSPSNVWEWICVVYTYNKSLHEHTLYINNTQVWSSSNYSLNIWNNFKYIGRSLSDSQYTNYWLSEIVFESWIWTSEQRSDYYDLTKSLYGIS